MCPWFKKSAGELIRQKDVVTVWVKSKKKVNWGQEEKGTTEDEMAGWHH